MKKRIILYIILTIVCMITIFYFSSRNTIESNGTSKGLIKYFVTIYEKVTKSNVNEELIINKLNYPVRKLAHFSIYFLLGIIIYLLFLQTNLKRKLLISISLCIIYASFDEVHQLFVFGRTAQLLDVFIDSMGSLLGILLLKIGSDRHDKKQIKHNKFNKCNN